MNNNDLEQLKVKIWINCNNQHWIGYYIRNRNHRYHKLNGPAFIYGSGSKFWWINDNYHRIDGPAVIDYNGNKNWYSNGELVKSFKYV